jgi:hypothetical protein
MVLLYMVTWIPSIYTIYVSIYTSTEKDPNDHPKTERRWRRAVAMRLFLDFVENDPAVAAAALEASLAENVSLRVLRGGGGPRSFGNEVFWGIKVVENEVMNHEKLGT